MYDDQDSPADALEDFDFEHQRSVRKDVVAHLGAVNFIEARSNAVFLGPPGTGKSHLSIALGIRACLAARRLARLLEPLLGLPPCEDPPTPASDGDVVGLTLPPTSTVTTVMETGPLTQVTGYVAMTPVQVRVDYQGRTDIEVISAEDEGFEAEVLVSDGEHRTFFKAQAHCSEGSLFVAIVAPEEEADAVPTPTGGG